MFSCITDDVDWSGEASASDCSEVGSTRSAMQSKCGRLLELLEDTELQRRNDCRQHEKDLNGARRDFDARLSQLAVQYRADRNSESSELQNQLAVAVSEKLYWRGKFEKNRENIFHKSDSEQFAGAPTPRSLFDAVTGSRSVDGCNSNSCPSWECQAEIGSHPDNGETAALHRVLIEHEEALEALRIQHSKHCDKLQDRLTVTSAEASRLVKEVTSLGSHAEALDTTNALLRAEISRLQQRLLSLVSSREVVEEKVRIVLAENRGLVLRMNSRERSCTDATQINTEMSDVEMRYNAIISPCGANYRPELRFGSRDSSPRANGPSQQLMSPVSRIAPDATAVTNKAAAMPPILHSPSSQRQIPHKQSLGETARKRKKGVYDAPPF